MKREQSNECEKFQELLPQFLNGKLNEADSESCENHLKNCDKCKKDFEQAEQNTLLNGDENSIGRLKHLRLKFLRKIVISVICTILVIVLLFGYIAPLLLSSLFHTRMQNTEQALRDYVQFTIPSSQIKSMTVNQGLFSMTASSKYEIYGNEGQYVNNEIKVVTPSVFFKPILSKENTTTDILNYEQISQEGSSTLESKWNKLEKIKQGTVTKLAIFLKNPINIDNVEGIFGSRSVMDYIWFEIDTGSKFTEYDILYPHWGFPKKYNSGKSGVRELSFKTDSINFKNEMNNFENISNLLGIKNIESKISSINKYISENGIKVKSIIIQSSTDNILKLKDNAEISNIQIIKVGFDY